MPVIQHVPYLGSAEEDVLLTSWLVEVGQRVKKGQPLAVIETLKAAFEVEAEHEGILLQHLAAAGTRVPASAGLCVIGAAGEQAAPHQPPAQPPPAPQPPAPTRVAPAALQRARQLGVDPRQVPGTGKDGLVRVADVERAAGAGRLDPAFVALVRKDAPAFSRLGSDLKLALYRKHGAVLGDGCTFAPGSLLLVDEIVLGKEAHFGPETQIEARRLSAGDLLHFGARCRVRATRIVCGDNAFFTDDIEIGGGGALDPEACLQVGSHGFVGEHVHLNPCRPLVIGDEVVISRQAVVMTHSFGGSALAGYPVRFAGVTLGDACQIGIGAVLFPGVEVGAGAIVLSASSVVASVPPGRLYGGVPARDLKSAAITLTPAQVAETVAGLVQEFRAQMAARGHEVRVQDLGGRLRLEADDGAARHVLLVATSWPASEWDALDAEVGAFDLGGMRVRGLETPLAAAFREFLRKRGVRLHPRTWAYRGGWL